jgi:hypothetical protein
MTGQAMTLRVHGATTTEVLNLLVADLPDVVRVRVDGALVAEGVWVVARLETREDGVVMLEGSCARGCVFARSWPAAWTLHQQSFDDGVGFESIRVSRGDEVLWSLVQMPDGDLLAKRGGELVARDELTDDMTFASFCERHLPSLAATLGEAAVLLSETDTAPPGTLPRPAPFRHRPREDDELDF